MADKNLNDEVTALKAEVRLTKGLAILALGVGLSVCAGIVIGAVIVSLSN